MLTLIITLGVLVLLAVFIFLITYTVVEPNKAHIVVIMGGGRKVYSPHQEEGYKKATAYFYIPFLMKRIILPLSNVKMEIPGFALKDKEVAPFLCEAVCWFRIDQPDWAVEKLDIEDDNFEEAVRETLEEQVRGIARAAAMKQEILDIMRDRAQFGGIVEKEVNGALHEWGLEIVKLEIVDFSDIQGSNVIHNYEQMRESQIASTSRKKIAEQNKEAEITEAESQKLAGIVRAQAERDVKKADVEKQKQVNIATQEAEMAIAKQAELANKQKVEADRTYKVGQANVERQAIVEKANGEAEAKFRVGKADADVIEARGTADANVVQKTGLAEAEIIKQKGLSEAEAKDKLAEALKKYNDAGITIEQLRAIVEIQKTKYENLGKALAAAHVNANLVQGGEAGNLLGFDLGPEAGAGIGQLLQALQGVTGKKLGDIIPKAKP